MSQIEAKKMGASFLEGNKYGSQVRVVFLNKETIDLCGGTHVKNTGEIEKVKILRIEKKGSGVYRIVGTAGKDLVELAQFKGNQELYENTIKLRIEKFKSLQSTFAFLNSDLLITKEIETLIKKANNFNLRAPNFKFEIEKINLALMKQLQKLEDECYLILQKRLSDKITPDNNLL